MARAQGGLYSLPMRALRFALVLLPIVVACSSSNSDPSGGTSGDDASTHGGSQTDGGSSSVDGGGSQTIDAADGPLVTYGQPYTGGQYNLGPVDFAETKFHNACAPLTKYAPAIAQGYGSLLAGIWNGIPDVAAYCDSCIYVTTAKGKSLLLRVVTYGDSPANSIDVSPEAYQILNTGEYPRTMTWQFAKCPDVGKLVYEFQGGSNEYWTSLWVRNARVPLAKVEVQSANHASFITMSRGSDGTLTDDSGFGVGTFSIRLTGIDGSVVTDTFPWPSPGIAGQTLTGQGNFQ